jgi:hypothetical protein
MSEYAPTFLYVVPSANSIPTTGSTNNLTAGQTGIFLNDYSAATAGNIGGAPYIYIDQGRANKLLPTLRSDKIAASRVIKFTKVVGSASALNEVWELSDFQVPPGQQLTFSINAHSFYLDTAFNNGFTRSVVVTPDCLTCGGDPCTFVDNEKVIDAIITSLNSDFNGSLRTAGSLIQFFDFQKIGSGSGAILRITSKPVTIFTSQLCDPAANPFMNDRVWFRPFAYVGPDTTADFEVDDKCSSVATKTLVQRSTYTKLTSDEVVQLEKDYYSYKVDRFKQIYRYTGYNGLFESYVESGVVYNQYLIEFLESDQGINAWNPSEVKQTQRVMLMVPNTISNIETILTAYLGAPTTVSGTSPTTTTTTSTSSTTTTSTTTLVP